MRSPSALRAAKRLVASCGILLQIVQLGPRRGDQLVAPLAQRAQIAPAEVMQRIDRLRVRLEAQVGARAGHQRRQALRRPSTRPAGVGTPSRSSTVGITSTERTESVTCRFFIDEYGARTTIGTWTTLS